MKITRDEHGHIIEILNSDGSEISKEDVKSTLDFITKDEEKITKIVENKLETISNISKSILDSICYGLTEYSKYKIKYPNKNDSGSDDNGDSSYVDDGERDYSVWEEA